MNKNKLKIPNLSHQNLDKIPKSDSSLFSSICTSKIITETNFLSENGLAPIFPSKTIKKLKSLLPKKLLAYNKIDYLEPKLKYFSPNEMHSTSPHVLHHETPIETPLITIKALSTLESEESSSKASNEILPRKSISKVFFQNNFQVNEISDLLILHNEIKNEKKANNTEQSNNTKNNSLIKIKPKAEINAKNYANLTEKLANLSSEKISIHKEKIKKIEKSDRTELLYQNILVEPEKLRTLEKHPRIRKSSFSKADKLIKEWLDLNGKLSNEQTKILGSSERVKKKMIFYYINQMKENQMPLQCFIDQKLLKSKKFFFASKVIVLALSKTNFIVLLNNLHEMFSEVKDFCLTLGNSKVTMNYLKYFIGKVLSFSNQEISVYLYKFFAKILTIYSDNVNARNLYKNSFAIAKANRLPHLLMTLHKRMGILSRKVGKNKVALKHFLRMLDLSWYLNNEQYEFLAYDDIGISFYYLNELEKANFYHMRMIKGEKEPLDSIERHLSNYKIKIILESQDRASEEFFSNLSKESSDEEEEILYREKKKQEFSKKDKQTQIEMRIFLKKEAEKSRNDSFIKNKGLYPKYMESRASIPLLKKREPPPKKNIVGGLEMYLMERSTIFFKKNHLISHLSKNRNLENFIESKPNNLDEIDEFSDRREIFKPQNFLNIQKMNSKNLEKIQKMGKKLKSNLEVCVLYLETLKHKKGQDNRRTGMLLKPIN